MANGNSSPTYRRWGYPCHIRMKVYKILGETYKFKDEIKKDCGFWNAIDKFWFFLEPSPKYRTEEIEIADTIYAKLKTTGITRADLKAKLELEDDVIDSLLSIIPADEMGNLEKFEFTPYGRDKIYMYIPYVSTYQNKKSMFYYNLKTKSFSGFVTSHVDKETGKLYK